MGICAIIGKKNVPAGPAGKGCRMELSQKFVRRQLEWLRPLLSACSIETNRKGQDAVGKLMQAAHRNEVEFVRPEGLDLEASWAVPKEKVLEGGVILYLHGGGYTCGDLEYAKGFGAVLAAETGLRVLCPAYRLAPEHPYPGALEDAAACYRYLLAEGIDPKRIVLAGESAGGGLIFCLCLWLKENGLPLPGGLIGISPWTDLTSSGKSFETNKERDPSMTREQLQFFARSYTKEPEKPLASPLFGDLSGLPRSLLFVGGDEVMLSDTEDLHDRLQKAGCDSQMVVGPELWHAYILYGLKERRCDMEAIVAFARGVVLCPEN